MNTSTDEFVRGGGGSPPSVGLTSSVLPQVLSPTERQNSIIGVTTRNVPIETDIDPDPCCWYVIRCTYGREKKAYEYLLSKGIKVFYPTVTIRKVVDGKNALVEESRLPNLFFAYERFEVLKEYVYDNVHDETKYIRFYYNQHHDGTKEPLVVPDKQIRSLMLICGANVDDILLEPFVVEKFQKGQHVVIKEGVFAGVEGVVARFKGQQRVGVVIEGLMTMVTAYVPGAFLERVDI